MDHSWWLSQTPRTRRRLLPWRSPCRSHAILVQCHPGAIPFWCDVMPCNSRRGTSRCIGASMDGCVPGGPANCILVWWTIRTAPCTRARALRKKNFGLQFNSWADLFSHCYSSLFTLSSSLGSSNIPTECVVGLSLILVVYCSLCSLPWFARLKVLCFSKWLVTPFITTIRECHLLGMLSTFISLD